MYYCKECGREFEAPQRIYEMHGQSYTPYETLYICPFCRSTEFSKKESTHCRMCGARLKNGAKEYCSEACKIKGEKLWLKQSIKNRMMLESPINKILREKNAYNFKNGTNYSYGQYVALIYINRSKSEWTSKNKKSNT